MFFKTMRVLPLLFLFTSCASSQVKPKPDRLITLEQTNRKNFDDKNPFFTLSECQSKEKKTCKILASVYLETLKNSLANAWLERSGEVNMRNLEEVSNIHDSDPRVKKLKMEIGQLDSKNPNNQMKIMKLEKKLYEVYSSIPKPKPFLDEKIKFVWQQGNDISKLMSKIESSKDGIFESDLTVTEKAALNRIVKIVDFLAY